MTALEFLSVALSIVLGLSVTLVLTSFLCAFRQRRETRLDWLPFAWALFVLVYQFDYWWELFQLVRAPGITIAGFACVLSLALILSVSGGLVLPFNTDKYPKDLTIYFQQDGRWGVFGMAVYNIVGTIANTFLWHVRIVDPLTLLNMISVALVCVTVFVRSRRAQVLATLAFGITLVLYVVLYVPKSY